MAWCIKVEFCVNIVTLSIKPELIGDDMPYLFTGLLLLNGAFLGYSLFLKEEKEPQSVQEQKALLSAPINFTNTTNELPPEIGD